MIVEPRTHSGQTLRAMREPNALASLLATLDGREAHAPDPGEVGETVSQSYGEPDEVWLICEVVDPASTRGRAVYVHIPREQVLAVLKLCRAAAAEARSRPLEESHARPES